MMPVLDTYIPIEDFKMYVKHRNEHTASSSLGSHMDHYKILVEHADHECRDIVEIIIMLINISILKSRPLRWWKQSSQIMIEKGKGHHIENLQFTQLCEAI